MNSFSDKEWQNHFEKALEKKLESIDRVSGGKNNKIFKILTANGESFIAKIYHRAPTDPRDRLKTEYGTMKFLAEQGMKSIPQPLLQNEEYGFAIYEFIEGIKVEGPKASLFQVEEFGRFLIRLKELSVHPKASALPAASEAYFNFQEVIDHVRRRMDRFKGFVANDAIDQEMVEVLQSRLIPALNQIESHAAYRHPQLQKSQQTISPSDCGFHNAIQGRDGKMIFLDFEYFGWDDPAKMVADFILHPGMNLKLEQTKKFAQVVIPAFSSDPEFMDRFRTLYPVFGIKWCLIILNEFLPDQMNRRRFAANFQENEDEIRKRQLSKVHGMLDKAFNESHFQ